MFKKNNISIKYIILLLCMMISFSYKSFGTITITANDAIWDCSEYITDNVVIETNAQLTIRATYNFSANKHIYVKKGGVLILEENGILTNADPNELWGGIIVYGDLNYPQTSPGLNHGIVILENGSIIENAACGIKLGVRLYLLKPIGMKIGNTYYGGIVFAEGVQFINNKEAVHFNPYVYNDNGIELNNISFFNDCDFILNSNAFFQTTDDDRQVYLCGVRGVQFKGCEFLDQQPLHNGVAIYSNDAGLNINLPESGNYFDQQCIISGFRYGIKLINNSSKPINILYTYLSDNISNIWVDNCRNFRFETSSINGGQYTLHGIYLEESTLFLIENNIIQNTNHGIDFITRSQINGNNYTKNNTFDNTCRSVFVQGLFSNIVDNSDKATGLRFRCNLFSNSMYGDIVVYENSAICLHQGYPDDKAGNHFGPTLSDYTIENMGLYPITYYYDYTVPYETPYYTINTIHKDKITNGSCIGVGYLGNEYYPDPNNAQDINIYEDIFSNLKINYDIQVYEYNLNYPSAINWTEYYAGDFSYQAQVDDFFEITLLKDSMDIICSKAIQVLLTDETGLIMSLFKLWISRVETPATDFLLAECYLDEDSIDLMDSILDIMPSKYVNYSTTEISNYKICLDYLAEWDLNNSDTVLVTTAAIDSLDLIASGEGISAIFAKGILEIISDIMNLESFAGSCEPYDQQNFPSKINYTCDKLNLIVMPNPTNDMINLKLENSNSNIHYILIYDIYGKEIVNKEVNEDDIFIDISQFSSGVYIVKCVLKDGQSAIRKIIKK